jgi:hypothetical protein
VGIDLSTVPDGSLIIGDTDLIGNLPTLDPLPYVIRTSADGTTWGDADAVVAEIRAQILDGSVAVVSSYENREATVRVSITGEDGDALAQGEEALMAEVNKGRNTLAWVPLLPGAVPCVFDVVYSTLDFESEGRDLLEKKLKQRIYVLTLACLPFPRTEKKVLIENLPVPSSSTGSGVSPTVFDQGTSTTNWVGEDTAVLSAETPAWAGGATLLVARRMTATDCRASRSNVPAPTGGRQFLRVTGYGLWASNAGKSYAQAKFRWAMGTGTPTHITPVAYTYKASTGRFDALFYLPSGLTGNRLRIAMVYTGPHPANVHHSFFGMDEMSWVGDAPFTSTTRQMSRTLPVYGSARTEGELEVRALAADGTTPEQLGPHTLVYTRAAGAGIQPPLRTWRTAGMTSTGDAALVSGAREALGAVTLTYVVPADLVKPGTYQIVARVRCSNTNAQTLTVTASTATTDASLLPSNTASVSRTLNFGAVSTWEFVSIGELTLPTVEAGHTAANLTLTITSATANVVDLDEAWIFNTDDGQLSLVSTSGSGVSMLRIAGATLDRPQPSVWVGTADGTAVVNAGVRVLWRGAHQFNPGEVEVFTVTTTTARARAALRYYPRAHTHLTDLVAAGFQITWVDDDLTAAPSATDPV